MTDRASAEGLLSRDNPRSRWHAEQVTPDYRQSWSCIPLTDAVEAAALRDAGPRPDSGIDVALWDDIVKFVRWSANVRDDTSEAIDVAQALLVRLSTPRTETSEP